MLASAAQIRLRKRHETVDSFCDIELCTQSFDVADSTADDAAALTPRNIVSSFRGVGCESLAKGPQHAGADVEVAQTVIEVTKSSLLDATE